ncbi:MAG: FG-GAP repeat domain-containing protein, partial [Steroidobacteraceae bacterium]
MRPFAVAWLCLADGVAAADAPAPAFTQAQPKLSSPRHALSNAFADVDGDRDPDLAVSFTDGAIRLYLNEGGRFAEAGSERGLPQQGPEIRALAWVDYDRDGDLDLFIAN